MSTLTARKKPDQASGSSRMRLLVFADAYERLKSLQNALSDAFDIVVLHELRATLSWLDQCRVDAVLILGTSTSARVAAICFQLRDRGVGCPIVVIDEEGPEFDPASVLDAGASDFLPAASSRELVVARVNAQIQAVRRGHGRVFLLGEWELRPGARAIVSYSQPPIMLTLLETQFLSVLLKARGDIVLKQRVLSDTWGYSWRANTHTVETHLWRLRQKLEPLADSGLRIVTEKLGYCIQLQRAHADAG